MKFPAIIRLLLTFYKSFFLFSFLITLSSALLYWEYGPPILKVLAWFKLLTQGLTWYFIRTYKKKEFYYYRNLGLRDTVLWSVTLGLDMGLFITLLILTHQWRP
ncbi:MAG: hypothetical protein BGO55_29370 [Sphingobacteriales bacterium 50-39]|nr:hypothetical protein [Sphingobacteriales bacterium]OJW60650.1 MAG: hypothetical protein BGO55_29370 [Sphingobacteriales bacterium 50-39]